MSVRSYTRLVMELSYSLGCVLYLGLQQVKPGGQLI